MAKIISADPLRLLLIRPSALGDVSRTVPCAVSLKQAYPNAELHWLVRDIFADVVRAHPAVDQVVKFPRRAMGRFARSWQDTRKTLQFFNRLRHGRYDRVYDLQGLARSGLFAWLTGAHRRVGDRSAREYGWLGYNVRHTPADVGVHTVDQMLGILAADGIDISHDMRLYPPPEDLHWRDQWLAEQQLQTGRYAVIAPTARWSTKRWPIERFAAITSRLPEFGFDGAVIVGSPGEEDQTRPLAEHTDAQKALQLYNLTGATSVGQMMAIIAGCGLLVCNDSAALHIGVGLGRRCVSVFGSTDPDRVGPYRYPQAVVCAPGAAELNYRDPNQAGENIQAVTTEQVMAQIQLNMTNQPPDPEHRHA